MIRETAYHYLALAAVDANNQMNYVADLSCFPCLDMKALDTPDDLKNLGSELTKLEEKIQKLREAFNETCQAEWCYQARG